MLSAWGPRCRVPQHGDRAEGLRGIRVHGGGGQSRGGYASYCKRAVCPQWYSCQRWNDQKAARDASSMEISPFSRESLEKNDNVAWEKVPFFPGNRVSTYVRTSISAGLAACDRVGHEGREVERVLGVEMVTFSVEHGD